MSFSSSLRAQWLTQSFPLTNGWNAVFLHVDASHTTLDALVGSDATNPILEVWRWNPGASFQFTDNPQEPLDTGSQWIQWNRSNSGSPLRRMVGNSAYLVRVGTNVSGYTWSIKGRPVAPMNEWTTTGLNFIGFPTVPQNPPSFESFLAQSPNLQQTAEIFQYRGGNQGTVNVSRVLTFRTTPVRRGQAFWVRAGTIFNRYFGPFSVTLSGGTGVDFQDNYGSSSLRLKNLTAQTLVVTVRQVASETPPASQPTITAAPPLLIRGSVNLTNLTYGFTNLPLNGTYSWTLTPEGQAGSEVEVVLGLNRAAIGAAPGSLLAGILRFTDSQGHSQVDVPVSGTANSTAGLWVGKALVNQVAQYLKTYQRDNQSNPVVSAEGSYIVTGTNTSLGAVPRPFSLRLIVHNPGVGGNAVLLRHVFLGPDAGTNLVVATQQSALHSQLLQQARRITATHLPWSETNRFWGFNGRIGTSSNLTTSVTLNYNDPSSNPFLHAYHPDHDNLDTKFEQELPQGAESYTVRRDITLNVQPPGNDFSTLIAGTQTIEGNYRETITVLGLPRPGNTNDTRQFEVRGVFTLNRIADVPTLTITP